MKLSGRLDHRGQAQLLIVISMTACMLSGVLFMIERSQRTRVTRVLSSKVSRLQEAIHVGVEYARRQYVEVGCDPMLLNRRFNLMNTSVTNVGDGSLRTDSAVSLLAPGTWRPTRRLTVNLAPNESYDVHFGFTRPRGQTTGPDFLGYPEDATVEIWTTDRNNIRVNQIITLVNTCSIPCPGPHFFCRPAGVTQARDYSQTSSPAVPTSVGGRGPIMVRNGGNLDIEAACGNQGGYVSQFVPMASANQIFSTAPNNLHLVSSKFNPMDIFVMREYLRTGIIPSRANGDVIDIGCGDVNGDNQVTEKDVGIMEKFERGYLQHYPVYRDLLDGCVWFGPPPNPC